MSRTKKKRLFMWGLAGIAVIFLFCLAAGWRLDSGALLAMPGLPFVFGMASKDISFSQMPAGIKKPGVYIEQDTSLVNRGLPSGARSILIIGQRLATGSVAALTPMQVFSENDAINYWGLGSMIHLMIRAAMYRNSQANITGIALDDAAAGVAATGTFTITGPATAPGTIRIWVGDQYTDVAINSGDSANSIAANINTALNANGDLPVTSAVVNAVVTVTARNKGLCGNDIGLGYQFTGAAGVACAIVAMANGATNPVLQNALNVVAGTRYNIIVTPYNNQTDLTTLKNQIVTVSGPTEKRFCIGVYATTGALAAATTLAGQVNYIRIVAPYVRYTAATQQKTISWQVAAIAAAALAADPDPSDPVMNMDMTGVAAPGIGDVLMRSEQETCLAGGVSPLKVKSDGTVQLVRMPATYVSDANSQPVFVDIHKITGMDYVADALISDLGAKAPKKMRTDPPATVDVVRNIALATAYNCQQAGVLTGVSNYKDQFIVEPDLQNVGQLDILMPSPVVDGVYVLAVKQVLY